MFLNNSFPYIKSKRNHFLIAILLGFLVAFIVIFLQPYGSGLNDFPYRGIYFIGYGVITTLTYLFTYFVFNLYYRKYKKWKWAEELFFAIIFILLMILLAELYTEYVINKKPSRFNLRYIIGWYKLIFPGFGVLMIIVSILLRNYFGKEELNNNEEIILHKSKEIKDETKLITITSSLKKESLTVDKEAIVYVESEDNYIHVYYFKDDLIEQKMLRNTLKDIQKQLPFLLKTHRSFLVNPKYILQLKGNAQNAKLYLNNDKNTIPVSKTYYKNIKKHIN